MSRQAVSPLLLQRYELKYLIPIDMVEPISKVLESHCQLDYFSQKSPDKFYSINSLYFDTLDYKFLIDKQNGAEPSYGFRVRSYSDDPKPPYYSEIKIKQNDFCNKIRAKIDTEDWTSVLVEGNIPESLDPVSRAYLQRFIRAIVIYDLRPKVLTQYRRKAYFSEIDEYARITFDRDMRYQEEEGYNLRPTESLMRPYDNEDIFPYPESCVVLELKAEKKVPMWMVDLIKRFNLTRDSFSKYGNSIIETTAQPPPPGDFHPSWDPTFLR